MRLKDNKTDQKNSVFMIFDLEFTIVILMLMNIRAALRIPPL